VIQPKDPATGNSHGVAPPDRRVLLATCLGTTFELYDFFVYGSLASFIALNFFSGGSETRSFILVLLTFGAGFVARPFGGLLFGRLGDAWSRKNSLLVSLLVMGGATFLIGILPGYSHIGSCASWILAITRLVQGFAVGGVYGGAATYAGEHAPQGKRGLYTSWIQTTGTVALILSLSVILATRTALGEIAFASWGWRLPFLLSSIFLLVPAWIHIRLAESPIYFQLKACHEIARSPWRELLGSPRDVRRIAAALFGAVIGQAAVWYTSHFYVLFFLEHILRLDGTTSALLLCIALVVTTPLYIVLGWLSDRVGRKPIILLGCLLAASMDFSLFHALTRYANPTLAHAQSIAPVVVASDPRSCSFQFDPLSRDAFLSSCDVLRSFLARNGIPYRTISMPSGPVAEMRVGSRVIPSFSAEGLAPPILSSKRAQWEHAALDVLRTMGYRNKAQPTVADEIMVVLIIVTLLSFSAMVYAPMAALLLELFPARIRYTSMSLPYQVGNGWFGGLLPASAFAIVVQTGNIYSGLWYPTILAASTAIVGFICLPETSKLNNH
jgi:MFS family permease